MTKKKKRIKKINLILAVLCFIIAISLILKSSINYKKDLDFYNNATEVEGYIFGVREKSPNHYALEYKYIVNNEIYKTYLSDYKSDKELKDYDSFTVYYEKGNPSKNVINKPKITNILITIPFSLILVVLGILNLRKKKL